MTRRSVLAFFAVAAILSASMATTAVAARGGEVRVDIKRNAVLIDAGQAVLVSVKARCPVGYDVLEAFVYISQEGNESDFGFFGLTCNGKQQRFVVRLNTFDEARFHPGSAHASALVLVIDPKTDETLSDQDSQQVKIRERGS